MARADESDAELLTPRQLEVLELLARGLTNREIAGVLGISPGTVKVHVAAVLDALDVTNRTEAAMALQELRPRDASADAAEESKPGDVPGFGSRPAIAVLPFDDLSPDPDDSYFAEALVEELTTGLASWRWFPVIARNSATAYGAGPHDLARVSRELGARFLLEGSVRRAGDRIRIHVQLIDGTNGQHIMAEKLEGTTGDLFAVQDDLVQRIVGTLAPILLRVEGLRALRRPVDSLDRWERFQRAMLAVYRLRPAEIEEAVALLEQVAAEAPDFAAAHAGLSHAHFVAGILALGATQREAAGPEQRSEAASKAFAHFLQAEEAGRRATAIDPLDPAAFLGLGVGLAFRGRLEQAIAAFERCVELNPSAAHGANALAICLGWTDRWEEAVPLLERAVRLSPKDSLLYIFEAFLAATHLRAGRYDRALAHVHRSLQAEPEIAISARPFEPAALAQMGRLDEARALVDELRTANPNWNLQLARTLLPPPVIDALVTGLRLAGWESLDG